ncbi:DEAD/DEAH box helicase [Geochorda subterranea]|uniref:Helicase-related protein n=1 Tax=Geochorda subterranea TaxID=3109564 RepID=A0ABZ1BSV5_9FIRM|nr:helicase-related protein [Limnochorda sp. LNt]WRP15864.1 helicase-related protein [Limnochorda sp. LNt]
MQEFLLPALLRARRYDRQAGFFSSSSLLVSAKGVEYLLRRVPRPQWPAYRLVVCERLDPADVEAIEHGERIRQLQEQLTGRMLRALDAPVDAAARDRLALLAAMVAVGFAEIRVVVPAGPDGRPRPGAIEHAKVAILHDAGGNTLVAFGSANESWQGWVHNNEQMDLYASWDEPTWSRYGRPKVERFERLWGGRDPHSLTVELPRAVRERLVALAPEELPEELVEPLDSDTRLLTPQQERVALQFVRDAPRMSGGRWVALTTAAVRPWPHHVGVLRTALEADAPRYLLCDEVGLGKTIEAAFLIRAWQLAGLAQRTLVLAPRALCEQWQEELIGKFSLPAWLYDGATLVGPSLGHGRGREQRPVERQEVFRISPVVLIVGTELARRQERQGDLLQAPPWDLIIVDEAHHARRTGYDQPDRQPNQLLRLLQRLKDRTRALLLLTATPMQIHPREVWDLLRLLGVDGPLGTSFERFESFYRALADMEQDSTLQRPVLDLLFETVRAGARGEPSLLASLERTAPMLYRRCATAVDTPIAREGLIRLGPAERAHLRDFFLAHAPTRQRLFRTTRKRLREYRHQGLISDPIPERRVSSERIPLSMEEQAVYLDVERYLARHYRNAMTGGQRGLGFVLTCYRQRLASSPYALRRSLERLRERIGAGSARLDDLVDDDDLAGVGTVREEELSDGGPFALGDTALAELDALLAQVRSLGVDSKRARLHEVLDRLAAEYHRVIIFTQYTDTMDYVRNALLERTRQVGCFSGRGGEVYDPEANAFVPVSKEELQERFRQDGGITLLVCTNAAAEGLNLQVCGAMVNYDLPWNPMRLEQRIGRIDRIGQDHKEVRVYNFFSTPSVEDDVYHALDERIGLFERFVGPLQPLISSTEKTIRDLAMLSPDERPAVQERRLEDLKAEIAELQRRSPALPVAEGFERPIVIDAKPLRESPVTVEALRRLWLRSPTLLRSGALRPVGDGVYELRDRGRLVRITFDPDVAQRRRGDAVLLTYGHPYLERWLAEASLEPAALEAAGVWRRVDEAGHVIYGVRERVIAALDELLDHFETASGYGRPPEG